MKLVRPFVIARGASTEAHSLFLEFRNDEEKAGWGEAAPSASVTGETSEQAERALRDFEANPDWVARILEDAEHIPGGTREPSVRAALVTAFLDAEGQRRREPLHRILNLPKGALPSSITLSIGAPAAVLKEAAEWDAARWSIFKVKLGSAHDEAVLKALRDRYPEKKIRVDANEAWSLATARARLKLLERLGCEFVEQPLPRDRLTESRALAREFDLPIVLDESVLDSTDALEAVRSEAGDGINVKLAKCGGPFEARRIVKVAKDADWKVMMGCMLESSLGIAAGAAFAGVLDYADLDGNVLLAHDPFGGFEVRNGVVATPERPGVGVKPRDRARLLEPLGAARG